MVQAERRMEAGAAYARAQPDLRACAVVGARCSTGHRRRNSARYWFARAGQAVVTGQTGNDPRGTVTGGAIQENKSRRKVVKKVSRQKSRRSQGNTRPSL